MDFSLESDHHYLSNHPDIITFNYSKQLILFIGVSCPADINVPYNEQKKLHKCHPLSLGFQLMHKMPVHIMPVVFGCKHVVSTDCIIDLILH